jgi:polar amino acid transport system substrate-binding protein
MEAGVLRVGIDPTYPPFEQLVGQDIVGLDVDIAREIARELELKPEFIPVSYDGLYEALATGLVDVLISALVAFPERTRDFAYSTSYFDAGQILISRAESSDIAAMEDLRGKQLAVELGSQGHVEAIDWSRRIPQLIIRPFESSSLALNAVLEADVDASLVDAVSGRLFLAEHPELRLAPEPVAREPYVMVVRAEDGALLTVINEQISRIQQSGRLMEIVGRWLPLPESH